MPEFSIRPYEPQQRQAVFQIAADTAYFGAPVEAFLDDRQLFCDAFCGYYTDQEPELVRVACADDQVIGYIMGSLDTAQKQKYWLKKTLPWLVARLAGGRYRVGKRTLAYARRMAGGWLRDEFPRPALALYPAHLHINLQDGWRGYGLGRKLMEAYLGELRSMHTRGVHLETTSANMAACILYEKMGFKLLDSRLTRTWQGVYSGEIENRCYGLLLG